MSDIEVWEGRTDQKRREWMEKYGEQRGENTP